MPFRAAAFENSPYQPSPYASEKPMKPTVLTPWSFMWDAIASDIWMSFCGVLNTQWRFASIGSTILADAAIEIIGTCASLTTSIIASEFGMTVEPTITSALSSVISLRVLLTALVVSEPSSSTIQLIFWPAMVLGSSAIVFFSGMPSDAAGPVADSVTPTVMSAIAAPAASASTAATRAWNGSRGFEVIKEVSISRSINRSRTGSARSGGRWREACAPRRGRRRTGRPRAAPSARGSGCRPGAAT